MIELSIQDDVAEVVLNAPRKMNGTQSTLLTWLG